MNQNNKLNNKVAVSERKYAIGKELSFAAKEAYKRLRTNLLFSFTGEKGCRVIGVTSSLRGEGKSTTSANLAYSLAEAGKRTLLIDADMRLSNVHKMFGVNQSPGLSNLLVGLSDGANLLQPSGKHKNLSLLTAGDIPPNPTELLSSKRMIGAMNLLCEKFDYIIIDLPPVDAVADALIVSKIAHGMIVVARQNYVDKNALDATIRQLRYHEAKILGFVLNGTEDSDKYYKGHYYKNIDYSSENDD